MPEEITTGKEVTGKETVKTELNGKETPEQTSKEDYSKLIQRLAEAENYINTHRNDIREIVEERKTLKEKNKTVLKEKGDFEALLKQEQEASQRKTSRLRDLSINKQVEVGLKTRGIIMEVKDSEGKTSKVDSLALANSHISSLFDYDEETDLPKLNVERAQKASLAPFDKDGKHKSIDQVMDEFKLRNPFLFESQSKSVETNFKAPGSKLILGKDNPVNINEQTGTVSIDYSKWNSLSKEEQQKIRQEMANRRKE